MDAEDKQKLDRILKLAEENNEYVRQVRRSQKTSQMLKAIYWVIVITFVLGGFYFVQPYLKTLGSVYGNPSSLFGSSDTGNVQGILDQLKGQPATTK